jgi:quinohemoprotein ethanol dehydrogenase
MGEGMLFLGQFDANVVALDIKTGKEVWRAPIEVWQDGYGITSAPLYYDASSIAASPVVNMVCAGG